MTTHTPPRRPQLPAIDYTWMHDNAQRYGALHCSRSDAIERAAEALRADVTTDGRYRYYASETGSHWLVSADDMAALGAALLAGHSLSECYSIWCADSDAAEDDEKAKEIN